MLNTIIHSDEITLWWDKGRGNAQAPLYHVMKDGKKVGETDKTHFTVRGLQAETEYTFTVPGVGEARVKTRKEKRKIDVTKAPYFAVPNGKTVNTSKIQKAFDDCTADACVYFPKGVYLSGALTLHSDMEIYLDEGAILQGTENVADYLPKRVNRFEGIEQMCYSSLLTLGKIDRNAGCKDGNLVIRGGGMIRGGGVALCDNVISAETERLKEYLKNNEEYVQTCENGQTIPGRARPCLVNLQNCQNVVFANVTFAYGPAWNVHFVYSKDIVTYDCKFLSKNVWNGDGWDPDSSENCTIFDCTFDTGDNSIAIKSGKNPEGNLINRPCKDIRIFDCHGGKALGIGSEMSGGIENVYIWDCNFTNTEVGLSIKVTKKRGGYLRNIYVNNCSFTNILARSVRCNDDGESAQCLPSVQNFFFENVEVSGRFTLDGVQKKSAAIFVAGLDKEKGAFRNFSFKNLKIYADKKDELQSIELRNVQNMSFENISFI